MVEHAPQSINERINLFDTLLPSRMKWFHQTSGRMDIGARPLIHFIACTLFTLILYSFFFYNRAIIEIHIEADRNKSSLMQVFWAGENGGFSEKASSTTRIRENTPQYQLIGGNLKHVGKVRIDPLKSPGHVTIGKVSIRQFGYKPIVLSGEELIKNLKPANHIQSSTVSPKGLELDIVGEDGQVELEIRPEKAHQFIDFNYWLHVFCILCVIGLLSKIYRNIRNLNWVKPVLFVILCCVTIMALMSRYNEHPDEFVHLAAGVYYQAKWLPPEICDPETFYTYSNYGTSRLNQKEIAYFLAGKTSAIFGFLPFEDFIRLRLFNVMLFGFLLWLYLKRDGVDHLLYPFLISAQAWYIFSYFNSEAFALFILICLIYQLTQTGSFLQTYYRNTGAPSVRVVLRAVAIGLLVAFSFFVKKNFYIVFLFLSSFLVIDHWSEILRFLASQWKKNVLVVLTSILFLSLLHLSHFAVNGTDRKNKMVECKNRLAEYQYKPSTPLEDLYPNMYLKKKGYSLKNLLEEKKWDEKIFQSTFGVYGYTKYSASPMYYHLVKFFGLLLLFFVTVSAFVFSSRKEIVLFISTFLFCLLMIGLALWWSWTMDFQAQGRYLFPVIPMIGLILHRLKNAMSNCFVWSAVVALFMLAFYSFSFYGLRQIIPYIA